ncbi:hypothetical protein BSLG_007183 [Batrachochytrium salamandrivorans]|nr:hypothetical protein BSLG_007183 [Batrachochytrium salamandrivorans]
MYFSTLPIILLSLVFSNLQPHHMTKGQVKTRREHLKSTVKPYIVPHQPTRMGPSEKKLKDMTAGEILHSIVSETDRLNAQCQTDLESFQTVETILSKHEADEHDSSKKCEAVHSEPQEIPTDPACQKRESLNSDYWTAKSNLEKSLIKRDTFIKTVEKVRIAAEILLQAIFVGPNRPISKW